MVQFKDKFMISEASIPGSTESLSQDNLRRAFIEKTVERLGQGGKVGQHLVPVYLAAIDESPCVEWAVVSPVNPSDLSGDQRLKDSPGYCAPAGEHDIMVTIIAKNSWKPYSRILKKRPALAESIAQKLGVSTAEVDERKLAEFALAHELGHVKNASEDPDHVRKTRDELSTLPLPDIPPGLLRSFLRSPRGIAHWIIHKDRYASLGIGSRKDLMREQEMAYKRLPAEDYADQFAVQVMRRLDASKSKTDPAS